jgi:uncharacterized protein YjbI with pentapeptide repeats
MRLTTSLAAIAALVAGTAAAADIASLRRPSVFDLAPGQHVSELRASEFADFACGTNGGNPSIAIADFAAFMRCPAERNGLREVYFRYDDEREFVARANALPYLESYSGTKEFDRAVIVSALFDDKAILQGLRIVTDPRVPAEKRMDAYTLSGFLIGRYRVADGDCRDLPLAPGETPVGNVAVKRECTKTLDGGIALTLRVSHFRKSGQSGFVTGTAIPTTGEFWSETRLDLVRTPDPAADSATLARVSTQPPGDASSTAARARNCPACDLHGAAFKRLKLTGAVLRGANLAGANFHAADLRGADLSGADLTGANLNRADLRQAKLAGAKLNEAMLFSARLDGADLTGAALIAALMGDVQLTSAKAAGAQIVSADLRNARLGDADFTGANLSGSRLDDVRATRINLSGVNADNAVFTRALLRNAKLADGSFAGADFYGANLGESDLSGADFSDADLSTAILSDTNQDRAQFAGATMPNGTVRPR